MSYFLDEKKLSEQLKELRNNYGRLIKNADNVYAHSSNNEDNENGNTESWFEHSERSLGYFLLLCDVKNLDFVFSNIEKVLIPKQFVELWKRMVLDTMYSHDIGKVNTCCQADNLGNEKFKHYDFINNSSHSILSELIFISLYMNKLDSNEKTDDYYFMLYLVFLHGYLMRKHHSRLDNVPMNVLQLSGEIAEWINGELRKNIEELTDECKDMIDNSLGCLTVDNLDLLKSKFESIVYSFDEDKKYYLFSYVRIIYSCIISSDYYATYEFKNNSKVDDFGVFLNNDKSEMRKAFESDDHIINARRYQKGIKCKMSKIDKLRCSFFDETESNLLKNLNKYVFYAGGPTSSGKTKCSINLALHILENNCYMNKIFMIPPNNTIAEQVRISLNDMSIDNKVINSISPIIRDDFLESEEDDDSNENNDDKLYLDRIFLHDKLVIISNVKLFDILFGCSKKSLFPLVHMCNSVIIMDEIQTYRNALWPYIAKFMEAYGYLYNIKFILISATLPKLDMLLGEKSYNFTDLVTDREKYFLDSVFKERVEIDKSLIGKPMEEVLDYILKESKELCRKGKKVLIEFLTIKKGNDFFNRLISSDKSIADKVEFISGLDSLSEKVRIIIRVINSRGGIILISTEVSENGLCIDMDEGFSPAYFIENVEQVMGRINRDSLRKGTIFLYEDYDSIQKLFSDDFRINFIAADSENMTYLKNKSFDQYYNKLLKYMKESMSYNIDRFNEDVEELRFADISKKMKLIDDDNIEFFIDTGGVVKFENRIISSSDLWTSFEFYCNKANRMKFSTRKIKLINILAAMSEFRFSLNKCYFKGIDLRGLSKISGIIYIPNDAKVLDNNKLNLEKFRAYLKHATNSFTNQNVNNI